ncbi:uncharacterized transmembrane protein DDB_G0289901 [Rhipicephalus sanguineus]|uniref:uncharacterized transmembrane protein DDB_G0289901 n=1 Tax=Rhipicephalus sanguineus TaxID=34632 RepID=UPI0020C2854C|nr:uncharacterized transmembrane protein DDB_G0289901 [Rhipicephalus sanguineus]
MLSSAAIPTYLVVLFLIPGTFSQNELFYRSETYCRRFVPPMITSALGLCTYPCLLLSNDQPPKILVISEPDGTVCKIYNRFLQTPQASECRAGFCQETQDYGIKKRMKRDVSTPVSSSQQNSSAAQKQLSSRRGSEKPKISRRQRIEERRRQMWAGCDCANMRGLFIDMSYPRSALSIGRSGRRGRRCKVGCRVICIFLINRYKHDPKWANLFEAAIGTSPGGNTGNNTISNQTGTTTSRINAVGPNSGSRFVGVNGSGSIGSAGTGLTSNQPTGPPPAAGAHNGASVINAGGGSGGGSTTSENTGSKNVGSASTSINGGTSAIASTTSGVMTIGVSSGGNGQNGSSRNGPVVSAQMPPAGGGGGGISAGGLRVSGSESGSSTTSSRNINGHPLQNTGISGVTAPSSDTTSASSSQRGTHSPDIGSVGGGLSEGVGTESLRKNGSDINTSESLINGSNGHLKPKVENAAGASTMTSRGTGSGNSIPVGNQTVGNGALGADTGGLPRQLSAGSPTSTVAGGPENAGGLSPATSSSVSKVGTSSLGSGYGARPISGSNIPVNFGGAYGTGANGFGSTDSRPLGPAGGAYSGMSPGYGNTGSFGNMPGVQPYGGAGRYGNNARFPGDFGIYEDDIFFQD